MAPRSLTAENLFRDFFWPLYPDDVREQGLTAARSIDANPANNPHLVEHLDDAADVFKQNAVNLFGRDIDLDDTDASVHRISLALTRETRDRWLGSGEPGAPDNIFFNAVIHGALYVGRCIVRQHGGAWQIRRPLWESMVHLKSAAGEGSLAVFHWWLKSLSDEAIADSGGAGLTLADRYRTHVEVPCTKIESWPTFIPEDRALPRLSRVRYDTLYKYMKSHLPELRDLGRDFPTPERFDEFKFRWLDFVRLGEGRMLLLHGPSEHGAHLFWLSHSGFEKAIHVPCDKIPEYIVRTEGETLKLLTSRQGVQSTQEFLWWGP